MMAEVVGVNKRPFASLTVHFVVELGSESKRGGEQVQRNIPEHLDNSTGAVEA